MGNGLLWLVGAGCLGTFGVLLRFAVQALEDRKYRTSAAWFFWSFVPLAIVCAVLVVRGEPEVPELARNIVLGFVGAALGASLAVWGGYAWLGTAANGAEKPTTMAQGGPSVTQNNQGGPNIHAPGGQFNFYGQPQSQATDGVITQAGVVVGKVFGGRRSPNDATTFEFVEITNANQFNPTQPFQFNGVTLAFQSTKSRVGLNIARPDAGMTYGGVVAKVIDR